MALSYSDRASYISGLPKVCQEAIDRYKLEDEATSDQRKRETAALEFQVPEKQWPSEVRDARSAQVVNGVPLPPRVMLSIPTLDQPIQLILNQERAASLSPTIHPISEDADDDTAEVIQGLYRHIEVDSRANLARTWAFDRAVKAGRGGWRVLCEFDPDGGHPSDQKIVIKRLLYQESMRLDPYAQEPDWSDADWGMVSTWVPWTRFKRHWPRAKMSAYTDGVFSELLDTIPDWFRDDQHGKAILVVEYFRKVFTRRTKVALSDGRGAWEDELGDDDVLAEGDGEFSREEDDYVIEWSKLTACEELETEQWDGRYIPLVPCIGRELIPFDGERRWVGIIEPNMDAARMCNYGASGTVESAALEPKAPFDVDPEEIAGFEGWWHQANVRNFPYLPRHKTVNGVKMDPIGRMQADMSKVQMNMMLYQSGMEFIHQGTGAWEAALGQSASTTKTKGGTQLLQQQHEQGNSHWLDNLAEISLTLEAKIVLDLIPHKYDRPGRVVRIVTGEGDPRKNTKQVILNAPFIQGPKGRPIPAPQNGQQGPQQPTGGVLGLQQPQRKVKHFDLTKGRYGVVVSIGKAYQSRVQEGSDRLGQILQADPALVPILGPNWMEFQDFPGAREATKVLLKVRDHQMPFLRDEDEQPDAQQQLQQAKGQMQMMSQQMQEMGKALEAKQVEQQGKLQVTQTQEQAETERERFRLAVEASEAAKDREVKLAVAQIGAQVDQMNVNLQKMALFLEERARVGAQAHEVGMAARGDASALTQQAAGGQQDAALADQGHRQALEQGAAGHAQSMEQGAAGHQQSMEAQEQAAALQPEPQEPV